MTPLFLTWRTCHSPAVAYSVNPFTDGNYAACVRLPVRGKQDFLRDGQVFFHQRIRCYWANSTDWSSAWATTSQDENSEVLRARSDCARTAMQFRERQTTLAILGNSARQMRGRERGIKVITYALCRQFIICCWMRAAANWVRLKSEGREGLEGGPPRVRFGGCSCEFANCEL